MIENRRAGERTELRGRTGMIDMAVGENDQFDVSPLKPCRTDNPADRRSRPRQTAIDENRATGPCHQKCVEHAEGQDRNGLDCRMHGGPLVQVRKYPLPSIRPGVGLQLGTILLPVDAYAGEMACFLGMKGEGYEPG
jgi:hypothetical protein